MMEQTKKVTNSNDHKNMKTILIAGLGNPGKEYEKTRHNAGFMLVDYFRDANREIFSSWEFSKKLNGDISTGKMNGKKIILLKPQTFMNLSGKVVSAAIKYYKIPIRGETSNGLIVVHDEIDLPLGSFRFSVGSSAAGHKGVQNIIDALGTKNFTRLRIGIDNRGQQPIETEKYVLGKFEDEELASLEKTFYDSANELAIELKDQSEKPKTAT
jgi:PTH1 family peptidyl-tRNA hydrolase